MGVLRGVCIEETFCPSDETKMCSFLSSAFGQQPWTKFLNQRAKIPFAKHLHSALQGTTTDEAKNLL